MPRTRPGTSRRKTGRWSWRRSTSTWTATTVSAAKIVVYGVAPIPWRSAAAEKAITGKRVSIETAAAAGEAAAEGAAPLSMNGYKVPLTKTVVKRALLAAVGNRYWEEA